MLEGVGLVVLIALALVALLAVAVVVGRARSGPTAEPEAPPGVPKRGLGARFRAVLSRGEPSDEEWRELEEALVRADAGTTAAREVVSRVRASWSPGDDPEEALRRQVAGMFDGDPPLHVPDGLALLMVVGVNGTGKTTTIGKLSRLLSGQGRKVAVAASDTYRAAAAEQLGTWAERAGADLVAQARGADPGAVAHDAVQAARGRDRDVLIVDTAGRIHTRQPLMEELRKVKRVLEKAAGKPVDEVLLVLDATTGQNGIAQARVFLEAVEVTGIVLTKTDGTARGGVVLAIRRELGVPVKLLGTGERLEDLARFDPEAFASRLVEE
jgi:fused signal recognition particle receptor